MFQRNDPKFAIFWEHKHPHVVVFFHIIFQKYI